MNKNKLYYHASNMADCFEKFLDLEGRDPSPEEVERKINDMAISVAKFKADVLSGPFIYTTKKSQNL